MIIDFGQYKGADIDDILFEDPAYLVWCYENIEYQDFIDEDLYEQAQQAVEEMEKNHLKDNFV